MYRTRVVLTGPQGSPWVSTMFFTAGGGFTAADAIADLGAFWNDLRTIMSDQVTISSEAEVVSVNASTGEATGITVTTPFTLTGTRDQDALPWETQLLVRWRTGAFVGGREIRGRTFIPGCTEYNNEDGKPNAAALTTVQTAATDLIERLDASVVIYSKKHHAEYVVASGSPWNQWAGLRSRRD